MPTRTTTAAEHAAEHDGDGLPQREVVRRAETGRPGRAPALATIARPSAPSPTAGTISKATAAVRRAISEAEEQADAGVEEIAEQRV